MIGEGIKMTFLLVSSFGYWEYFRTKHKIGVYFAPLFTISVQFCILLAAGLLNCLEEAAVLLHGAGFFLFIREIYKKKHAVFSSYRNVGYLYFLLVFFAVGFAVQGKLFTQIDNFTHWATVVRNMLSTDRFPNFQATAIEFTSYPLGSSALLYFVCKLVGGTESAQMWAQAYFMLCAILPVFSCCRKNRGAYFALVTVMTGFLFHYNIPITELLVDTLMPLAGMGTALFIVCHYAGQNGETERSAYDTVPLLIWTMNIKHAALFFTAFGLVLLYLCIGKENRGRKQWAIVAGTVLLANLLWSRHCDYVFDGGAASRHSLSLGWFQSILGDKNLAGILETVKMVLLRLATRTECLWLLAWCVAFGILMWRKVRGGGTKHCTVFLTCGISLYVVYAIGIGAMYVFSMEDYGELLAFTRYMRAIDVALYYMLTVFAGMLFAESEGKRHTAAMSVCLVLLTAAGWYWQTGDYLKEKLARCPVEWRQELEAPIAEYGIRSGKRYLLCVNQEHHGWPRRLWRYHLQTGAVDQVMVTEEAQLQAAKAYDYVVILDEGNPVIEAWRQENYPETVDRTVIENFTEAAE